MVILLLIETQLDLLVITIIFTLICGEATRKVHISERPHFKHMMCSL